MQKELDGRYKGKSVEFLAVSTGDPDWYLREFKRQTGASFPWLLMDIGVGTYFAQVYDQYGLDTTNGHPTLMLLDHQGIVRLRASGNAGKGADQIDYRAAFDLIGALLEEQAVSQPPAGNQVGQRAFDFTLNDFQGNPVTLSKLLNQDKLVLLSFWGTGCLECGALVPGLFAQDLLDKYGPERLIVLGIDQYSPLEALKDFVRSAGITYPVLKDELGEVAWRYQASGDFIFLLLDAEGVVLYRGKDFDEAAVALLDARLQPPAHRQEGGEPVAWEVCKGGGRWLKA